MIKGNKAFHQQQLEKFKKSCMQFADINKESLIQQIKFLNASQSLKNMELKD